MDLDLLTPDDFQKGFGYLWNILLDDEASQICGVVMLENLENFSLMKASKFNKSQEKKGQDDQYHFLQNCLPLRFKGVHMVHQPWWVTMFINIAKPFMSAKLRSRVRSSILLFVYLDSSACSSINICLSSEQFYHHGKDFEGMEKDFNVKDLPVEVGGEKEFDFHSTFATEVLWRERKFVDVV